MAKEPSWRAKAIYIVFALALVFGLSAAVLTPQPASANDTETEIAARLEVATDAGASPSAEWQRFTTNTEDVVVLGDYAAELYVLDGATDMALVWIPVDPIAIEDITELGFWKKVTAYGAKGWNPTVVLAIDANGDGEIDWDWADMAEWHFTHVGALLGNDAFIECESPTQLAAVDAIWAELDALNDPDMKCWGADSSGFVYPTAGYAALSATNGFQQTSGGVIDPTDDVLMVGIVIGGSGNFMDETAYVEDLTISGSSTIYDLEPGQNPPTYYKLVPHIALNVKTADETFTVFDDYGPVSPGLVSNWHVTKGEGIGVVSVVGGGEDGDNYITVRMVTAGDCIITADVAGFTVNAEKKWGEIYRTELWPKDMDGGEESVDWQVSPCDVTYVWELVIANFLPGPVPAPAGGAKVTWWLLNDNEDSQEAIRDLIATFENSDSDATWGWGCGRYAKWATPPDPGFLPEVIIDNIHATHAAGFTDFTDLEDVGIADATKVVTFTDHVGDPLGEGFTFVSMHSDDITDGTAEPVIVVVLADYPLDKNGQNPVCVEFIKLSPVPPLPPTQVKIPQVRWAGEKIVLEKKWGDEYAGQWVTFQLEHPGLGTLEPVGEIDTPWGMTGGGWTLGEIGYTWVGEDGVARFIIDSEDPGQADIKCVLYEELAEECWYCDSGTRYDEPETVLSEHAFVVWFLKLEEVAVIFVEEVEPGLVELAVQVKGWFTSADLSTREAKPVDWDGDTVDDAILPAGRWVLPDDWARLAGADWKTQRPWWDIMDSWEDGVISTDGPLGSYDGGVNTTDTTVPPFSAEDPVIGPFSTLQPIALDPVTGLPIWVATASVPADMTVAPLATAWTTDDLRTTVVPNFALDWWDAPMPPAEVTFMIRAGTGSLDEKIKKELEAPGPWGGPFYAVEIPAHWAIPPLSYPSGYSWDSWDWGTTETIGPYWFWTDLGLPPFPDDDQAIEVYSDNHGFAAVWVTGPGTPVTVTATADYPYLGKHPAMRSDELVVWGQGQGRLEGDVNPIGVGDDLIDAADALLIAKHIVGTLTLTGDDLLAADVDDSTVADGADALLIAKYIVGTITSFPGGTYIP